ncbi:MULTISPECIES: ABC transporter permease [unclassified Sphingobacterium]|uniref:ABC transporter permease n=2 Tax=unclassified Sphingobacterium TaxID=2609468 RepID=UPI0020C515D5|nr:MULTISPECIES: FtsX-like permease family protein [unclassified Sphingobacterium]
MNWRWILLMAWRDSRKNRSRLFLFISSIILGIAALVAMNSFNENLRKDIDSQAAELIGADLELESRREPSSEAMKFIDSLKGMSEDFAKEERFMSMIRFPKAEGSRLVQVRAIEGHYPFYGEVETNPSDSYRDFGTKAGVYVENSLLLQFNAVVNDSVQLGNNSYPILGNVLSQPGQAAIAGAMAPSVFVPIAQLKNSGLQQQGSRIEYHYYFKLPKGFAVDKEVEKLDKKIEELQLRASTIQTTKENTGRSFADMASFMELVGFVALLLGCIGVSSSVQIYVREKLLSVAVLRCLGTTAKQAFYIFLVQFAGIGLIGGIIGAVLGSLIQYLIPVVMQDVIPVSLTTGVSWLAILEGIGLGVVIAVLFALLPLLAVRNISPLNSIRISDKEESMFKDKMSWWVYLLILIFITGFARLQMADWIQTLVFVAGVGITFLLLYGVAKAFTYLIRKFFPKGWPYLWRQGLSNLYRPNNQTVILMISIGLGTALISTMFLVQDLLINRVKISSEQSQANMLMFDIQPSQHESLSKMAKEEGYPILEAVPVVTMQLQSVNGVTLKDVVADTSSEVSSRAFRGEIRATYRDSLTKTESITSGKWVGVVGNKDTASVSLDQNYADNIKVKVGDRLSFNVQGLIIPAKVSSIRQVDWNRFQSNFRVVFAKGSIDQAPQFYLMMTKVPTEIESSKFQQKIVNNFPNVSVIDMNAVLTVLQEILDKIGFIIQFMGAFSILTGIIVLISSVRISKFQRIRENVLLRTLGASRKQIFLITISEYLFLGLLSALTGIIISLLASYLLAIFVFESVFVPSIGMIALLLVLIVGLTVLIGLINSLSVINRSPLEALRKE